MKKKAKKPAVKKTRAKPSPDVSGETAKAAEKKASGNASAAASPSNPGDSFENFIRKIQIKLSVVNSRTSENVKRGLLQLLACRWPEEENALVFTDTVREHVLPIATSWLEGRDLYGLYHFHVVRPAFLAVWGQDTKPKKPFLDLVDIPAGSFTMGSPKTEVARRDDEDQVEVRITKPFRMGRTVVTQGQWQAVMGTEPELSDCLWDDDYPACVIWDDAVLFCETLTKLEREAGRLAATQSYRLPTEAEWEYACRAGTTTAFSFGNNSYDLLEHGWVWYERGRVKGRHKVAKKKRNPWGLFDMYGNVWEWCADWYDFKLTGGDDPVGPPAGSKRVIRGGDWSTSYGHCGSARRSSNDPSDRYHGNFGFRVVLAS